MGTSTNRNSRGTVLLVANFRPDVGFAWWLMENFWVQFASIARACGLDPVIAYPTPGQIPESIRAAGIATVIQQFPGEGVIGLVQSLRLVVARRVRCIYFTDRGFTSFKYALFRLFGVRLIINHDHTPGDRPPVKGIKGFLKHFWRRIRPMSCDLQLCVSPLIRERAIANARIPAEKAVVIQNGIEPIERTESRDYARRLFGIPDDALICVTVGRAHPYKRIDFVIEVARRCIVELGANDLYFMHCGDGPDLERLRRLAEESGLGKHFIFAGKRSDVHAILCSADVAIHASKGEAFSLAVLEYMSAGLATLVPDVPSVCQAVRNGDTGIVYADGDVDDAATAILRLRGAPDTRNRLGAAAAAEVRRRYSLADMNEMFRLVVANALDRRGYTTGSPLHRHPVKECASA